MASPSFRDRFFTPPVARAIMSPLGIVLAGAGTAGAVLAGVALPAALVVGAAAWGVRVLAAVPKAKRGASGRAGGVDPYTLNDPWRAYVLAAQGNRNRFERTVTTLRPGPLQERLGSVAGRFDDAVDECWRIATRGNDIEAALRTLDTRSAQVELAQLQHQSQTPATQATIASLQAQLASANRMVSIATGARDHLRLLDARMDEMIARAAELSVTADADVGALGADIDGLVNELEALRQAMEETGRASSGSTPSLPTAPQGPGTTPGAPDQQSGGWAMPSSGS